MLHGDCVKRELSNINSCTGATSGFAGFFYNHLWTIWSQQFQPIMTDMVACCMFNKNIALRKEAGPSPVQIGIINTTDDNYCEQQVPTVAQGTSGGVMNSQQNLWCQLVSCAALLAKCVVLGIWSNAVHLTKCCIFRAIHQMRRAFSRMCRLITCAVEYHINLYEQPEIDQFNAEIYVHV